MSEDQREGEFNHFRSPFPVISPPHHHYHFTGLSSWRCLWKWLLLSSNSSALLFAELQLYQPDPSVFQLKWDSTHELLASRLYTLRLSYPRLQKRRRIVLSLSSTNIRDIFFTLLLSNKKGTKQTRHFKMQRRWRSFFTIAIPFLLLSLHHQQVQLVGRVLGVGDFFSSTRGSFVLYMNYVYENKGDAQATFSVSSLHVFISHK